MQAIKDWFKDAISFIGELIPKNFFPFFLLLCGIVLYVFGLIEFWEKYKILNPFCKDLGISILGSGFFLLLLKSVQYMGVFKEELTKVIFEPKYIRNRNDLPEYWEKLSLELFKNMFPKISVKLLKDVSEFYFPNKKISYSEDVEHTIYLKPLIPEHILSIEKTSSYNIISNNKEKPCTFSFSTSFQKNNLNPGSLPKVMSLKINGVEIDLNQKDEKWEIKTKLYTICFEQIKNKEETIFKYSLLLKGLDRYEIRFKNRSEIDLTKDNVLYFKTPKLLNKLKVDFQHPENLKIDFKKCGTIRDFTVKHNENTHKQYYCDGIIYPEQGYVAIFSYKPNKNVSLLEKNGEAFVSIPPLN